VLRETLLLLMISFALEARVARRAAFDFGSGSIRLHVADVDTEKHQVIKSVYTTSLNVFLSEELSKRPDFSPEIQETALATAKRLKQIATQLEAEEFFGIATEAYRTATNGAELAKRYFSELSIPVEIVSKEAEGKFSFITLAKENAINPRNMVCCDIGGGSFQITYTDPQGAVQLYYGPFGRITTKNALITHVKCNDTHTPNPVTLQEWEKGLHFMRSALPPAPQDLLAKISEPGVQIIGVAGHPPELAALGDYRQEDLLNLRNEYLNKKDEEFISDQPFFLAPYAVSDLILVCALMEKLGVTGFSYQETHGSSNSTALLVTEELWK